MATNPFFTIVIPTYNPRKYLRRLLKSISTNKCKDNIEIIISDDISTEPFGDILEDFNYLNIRQINNDRHHGFPRAGRQNGADEAKGTWICFTDQDDYWTDGAFDEIYAYINKNNVKNYLVGNFIEEVVSTGQRKIQPKGKGWTHGKFYEKSFLDSNNIRYDEISYCEDINFSVKIECFLTANPNIEMFEYENPLYIWRRRNDSLADERYFVKSMPDYVKATLGVISDYIEKYKDNSDLFEEYNVKFIVTLLHFYFYFQSDILWPRKNMMLRTAYLIQPMLTRFKKNLDITNHSLVTLLSTEMLMLYNRTRTDDFNQIPFMERMAFEEWLNTYFE